MRPGEVIERMRARARGPALVALAVCLLVSATVVGLRLPGLEFLSPFAAASELDYSAGPLGGFSPLESAFVAEVLGLPATEPGKSDLGAPVAGAKTDLPAPVAAVVHHPLTNDDFNDAYAVKSLPFQASTSAQGASRQADEGGCSGPARRHTLWYRYMAPVDVGLVADTFGTHRPVSLGVFTGSQLDGLQAATPCDEDVRGNTQVSFPAKAGTTYFIQIALSTPGRVLFNLSPFGNTALISRDSSGRPMDLTIGAPAISADGRYVAFAAEVPLVEQLACPRSFRCMQHIYVTDRLRGATRVVSVASDGTPGNARSMLAAISGDGRFVSFSSDASNLVPDDRNLEMDIFVHDLVMGRTERVSVSSTGEEGRYGGSLLSKIEGDPYKSSLSWDGRYVAFESHFSNIVPGDTGNCVNSAGVYNCRDVLVHDRLTRETTRVSVSSSGVQGDGSSNNPWISGDGRYVTFRSSASTFADNDADVCAADSALPSTNYGNGCPDIFLHDRLEHTTTLVSASYRGGPADGDSGARNGGTGISADGRFIAYSSVASNLVPGDTNGGSDVFVYDRSTRRNTRVSVTSSGQQQQGTDPFYTTASTISSDGRYVAFESTATNLVPGDTNEYSDVFVHDRVTGTTIRVSVSSAGVQGDLGSGSPAIAADGRTAVFRSEATNFASVPFTVGQIFVHERPQPIG